MPDEVTLDDVASSVATLSTAVTELSIPPDNPMTNPRLFKSLDTISRNRSEMRRVSRSLSNDIQSELSFCCFIINFLPIQRNTPWHLNTFKFLEIVTPLLFDFCCC